MRKHAKTSRQVAYALGLSLDSATWIEDQAEAGLIPSIVVDGVRLFDAETVDMAIAKLAAGRETEQLAGQKGKSQWQQ